MEITVVSRETGELRALNPVTDVYYIKLEKKIPVFFTKYGTFYQIVTLDVFDKWLADSGFLMLDTVNLVNTKLINYINKDYNVYFCGTTGISATSNKSRIEQFGLTHMLKKE